MPALHFLKFILCIWSNRSTIKPQSSKQFVRTGRLATENKSLVSICVAKNFDQGRKGGRPCKILLISTLITIQNLVAVSHAVCSHVEGPKNIRAPGTRPLGTKHTPPHTCYRKKISSVKFRLKN